ncbi:hypothetical protein [Kordiimonas aestuarii]|uniref:hypothetical protein n=1 Tax=Kordiimonas aestuarii TaxID=1005925 RepID=UPI0021D3BF5A|nr:hypothetical protein [Kordiimonas aestuarii]
MLRKLVFLIALCFLISCDRAAENAPVEQVVTLSLVEGASENALDGRLILIFAKAGEEEPRFQVRPGVKGAQVFGMNVDALAPGTSVNFTPGFGYPKRTLGALPAGEYVVQALLHKYETFALATGHTVKLPMDQGEGQQWNKSPGNIYSQPQTVHIDPASGFSFEVVLDQVIPPIEPPADSKYVRHLRMKSELLSQFWGRDMYLGAHVLLPEGFDEHPEARYPLAVFHGHFPSDFGGFRETPPDADLVCEPSERFGEPCYNRIMEQEAYDFYKSWTGPDFPRMIIIEIQHPTPYYDDSYAVNSANMGPYGDAITHELIPFIEKEFRGIGEGWARFLYGGSTGGWEAAAAQIFYPDDYNGAFIACPDPLDFRAYELTNIYEDANAYFDAGPFTKIARPAHRDWLGEVSHTVADENHLELALGDKGRSGGQWDIWEAVYSPMGPDGYPKRLWDKETGVINHDVASYWQENYDLRYILERDWATLGPKLAGKLHIYVGDMDNYYLNNAVYLTEDFLKNTSNPHYGGVVDYGDRAEHCWNGDHENGNHISRLHYNSMYVDKIVKRIETTAPKGADLTSWRY